MAAGSREIQNRKYIWVKIAQKAAFAPRDGAGALVYQGKMWLIGGWSPKDKVHFPRICNNEVWCSTDGAHWDLVKPNTFGDDSFDRLADWEGRHTAGYAIHDGKMWIVGGDKNQGHYQRDVWSSTDGVTWSEASRNAPWAPRVLHHTVAFKGRIWVLGGQTIPRFATSQDEETVFYNDVWWTTDGARWTRVAPQEPWWTPRGMIGGGAVFQDRMWLLGGGTYDTPQFPERRFYNDVWSSVDGETWQQHTACAPWAPRQYHDVAVFDGRMWILEGAFNGENRNDVWRSEDGVNWHKLPDTPWPPRHAASVFVFDEALWVAAGSCRGVMYQDVWKLVTV